MCECCCPFSVSFSENKKGTTTLTHWKNNFETRNFWGSCWRHLEIFWQD
jgi:hypothetical protein